jgi:hypothetical protein
MTSSKLESLYMVETHIDDEFIKVFSKEVARFPNIMDLDLSHNSIPESFPLLMKSL